MYMYRSLFKLKTVRNPLGNIWYNRAVYTSIVNSNTSNKPHYSYKKESSPPGSLHNFSKSFYSNQPKTSNIDKAPTAKEKLKQAVKAYGSTVIVVHVSISLVSLGMFYILVSSGVDVGQFLQYIGITGSYACNAGTFLTAYTIHKMFAPVRISITLATTPFIVKYLRHIGVMKKAL